MKTKAKDVAFTLQYLLDNEPGLIVFNDGVKKVVCFDSQINEEGDDSALIDIAAEDGPNFRVQITRY